MSLELYDNALEEKIKKVFDNFIMAPPENAFNRSNEEGKVKLPLISAYRLGNPINFEEYNRFEVMQGRQTMRKGNNSMLMTQGLPVTITYQIDIWAQLRTHADGIYRELVYYLLTNPDLTIKLPNTDIKQDFLLKLTDVDTSTDYASFDDRNIVHRYTLTYEVDEARMFFQSDVSLGGGIAINFINPD